MEELAAVLDHLGICEDIHIVGQCEGGVVGYHFAAQYPKRVKAIVTSSTLCYTKITVADLCKDNVFSSFETADVDFQEKMVDWHGKDYAPELYSLFLQMGGAYGSGIFDIRDFLGKIKCPALVLYPDRSGLFDVEQAVFMYKALPSAALAVLPYCGHNTYAQQQDEYRRHILSFFARHESQEVIP
jgi:pimeloyl-ACP methyl ester carboxylesterase